MWASQINHNYFSCTTFHSLELIILISLFAYFSVNLFPLNKSIHIRCSTSASSRRNLSWPSELLPPGPVRSVPSPPLGYSLWEIQSLLTLWENPSVQKASFSYPVCLKIALSSLNNTLAEYGIPVRNHFTEWWSHHPLSIVSNPTYWEAPNHQVPDLCTCPLSLCVNLQATSFLPSTLTTALGPSPPTWLNIRWALLTGKPIPCSSRKLFVDPFPTCVFLCSLFLQLLPINEYGNPGWSFDFLTYSALLSISSSSSSWRRPFTVSIDISFCIQVPFGSLMVQEHSNNNPKRNGYERLVFKHYSQWGHAGLWSRCHKTTSTPPWPPNHSTRFLHCELFDATSLSTSDYCFQAPNSCRDLSRGWKNQLNLGLLPDVANGGSASSNWQQPLQVQGLLHWAFCHDHGAVVLESMPSPVSSN